MDEIAAKHKEIDALQARSKTLLEEINLDPVKQKAVSVYERLSEAKQKNEELKQAVEMAQQESAPQEKARLLEQVKQDNIETSGMERKIAELEDEIKKAKDVLMDGNAANDSEQGNRISGS